MSIVGISCPDRITPQSTQVISLFFISVHVHPATAGTIPNPLQELPFVKVYTIFVLVNVHKRIGALSHRITQCSNGGILDIGRCILDDEERHQAVTEFRLTTTFRTE